MTSSTITQQVGAQTQAPKITPSWKRGAVVLVGLAILAALGFSAVSVFTGGDTSIRTVPTVWGDRDAAFIESAQRYQAYLATQAAEQQALQAYQQSVQAMNPPAAHDRDEAFRQSMERQALLQQNGGTR